MKKTAWFDRNFNFGLDAGMLPFLLERLDGAIVRLQAKVINVPEDILAKKFNDKWSIKQNIGHLAEVNGVCLKRIDELKAQASPMSPADFEPTKDYNAMAIGEVLNLFIQNRRAGIAAYRALSEDELSHTSLHPRLQKVMNAVDLAFFEAEHDDHHLVRINEILSANYYE